MKKVLNLYKPQGTTPLQLIQNFQKRNTKYAHTKLGYAGRLDPMADGVLLVLVDEENKRRKEYESLEKSYSFDCLFGIATDTADALGLITSSTPVMQDEIVEKIPTTLASIQKQTSQLYPAYSSRTVKGKPLYYYARRKLLHEITIPSHPIAIYELTLQKITSKTSEELLKNISTDVSKVIGDFRQKDIVQSWEKNLSGTQNNYPIAACHITCSSGTYVRAICEEIGKKLGIDTLALRITRESVGDYMLKDSLRVQ